MKQRRRVDQDRSLRVSDADNGIVPFQSTKQLFWKFVKRKTFDTCTSNVQHQRERVRHGSGRYSFVRRNVKLKLASAHTRPIVRPSIDKPLLQRSHFISRIVVVYRNRNNPVLNAEPSLLIFHYVYFWSAYLQPSIPIRPSRSTLSCGFNLPIQLAWNCTAQRLWCVWWWWTNISVGVDGMRIVMQRHQ